MLKGNKKLIEEKLQDFINYLVEEYDLNDRWQRQSQSQSQPQPQHGYTGVYTQQQSYPQCQPHQGYRQRNNGGYMTPPHDGDYRQQ